MGQPTNLKDSEDESLEPTSARITKTCWTVPRGFLDFEQAMGGWGAGTSLAFCCWLCWSGEGVELTDVRRLPKGSTSFEFLKPNEME